VSAIVTKNISILFTRWPHIFHMTTLSVNKLVFTIVKFYTKQNVIFQLKATD